MSSRTTYADVFLCAALGEEKYDEWKRKEKEMVQTEATGDALTEKSGEQITDSCGCVFCDLNIAPELRDGKPMHFIEPRALPEGIWIECSGNRTDEPKSSDSA